jgi:DNA-nicking Smr family endonuclease
MAPRKSKHSGPAAGPLSDADARLWDQVARSAKPLTKKDRLILKSRPAEPPLRAAPEAVHDKAKESAPAPRPGGRDGPTSAPPLAGLDRRRVRRLARGNEQIDARIDLHGMRQAAAQEALLSFLKQAQGRDYRLVLVITGKGNPGRETNGSFMPDREPGVLRREVPRWFATPRFRALVAGFETAAPRHGGEGAIYVQVRRRRTTPKD